MILMGLVSLAIFIGMPKLVENSRFLIPLFDSLFLVSFCQISIYLSICQLQHRRLQIKTLANIPSFPSPPTVDPEMRAEFEEQSKKNPMNSLMAGPQPGSNPMGNFDVAGFLAGQGSGGGGKKEDPEPSSGNGGKKGGKR